MYLTAQNAQMEAYQTAYVENGVSAGDASTTVGTYVKTKLNEKYGDTGTFKTGLATITATTTGNIEISTTDFVIEGEIADKGGNLTWGEIELNVPRIVGMPLTYELNTNSSFTIQASLKGTTGAIHWESSDTSIATVIDGVVTATSSIETPTAEVTITASFEGCESKTCKVTVKDLIALLKDQQRGVVLSATKNTKLQDNCGNIIILPAGFGIANESGNNVEDGIVIEDDDNNQFVWVPVGEKIKVSTNLASSGTIDIPLNRYDFDSSTGEPSEYSGSNIDSSEIVQEFVTKTNAAQGYYIGRYETGIEGATYNSSWIENSQGSKKVVCKKDAKVYNNISLGDAKTDAQQMYSNNTTLYKSSLMNSYAWDTAIYFIQKCGTGNNHEKYSLTKGESKAHIINASNSKVENAGINILNETDSIDVQCKIYDMAGNVREWTTERTGTGNGYVRRGGGYANSSGYTAERTSVSGVASEYQGFRVILYIM